MVNFVKSALTRRIRSWDLVQRLLIKWRSQVVYVLEVRPTVEDQVVVWRSIGQPRPYPKWYFFLTLLMGIIVVAVLWSRFRQKSVDRKQAAEMEKLIEWIERQGPEFEPFWKSIERELTSQG